MSTTSVMFHAIDGFAASPAFSEVAVIPPTASLILIGGQNAVSESREMVGKGDAVLQAQTIKRRIDAALATVGCDWTHVVRVQVYLVTGVDPRAVFQVFMPALAARTSPPLVGVYQVTALANPDFLLEISVEAAR